LLGALAYYDVKGGPNVRIFEKLGINFKVPIKIRTFYVETDLKLSLSFLYVEAHYK
jgi:hypothetical protein